MTELIIKAPAKLNLNLHVLSKDKKSLYHFIEAVNCSISLYDELLIKKQDGVINVFTNSRKLSDKLDNLCYKAAFLLKKKEVRRNFGAKIFVNKNIPIKAGLGGGSSDAAATLKGLVKLWDLKINDKQLVNIAKRIGMDVCYCLTGGLGCVSGFGESVEKINLKMPKIPILIIVPGETKPSTGWAYQNLDTSSIGNSINKLDKLLGAIEIQEIKKITQYLHNDFEDSMSKYYPVISEIKEDLLQNGALNAILAGSGLATVGFFLNIKQRNRAEKRLSRKYKKIILTKTI